MARALARFARMRFYYPHEQFSSLSPHPRPVLRANVYGLSVCLDRGSLRQVSFLRRNLHRERKQEQRHLRLPLRSSEWRDYAPGAGGGEHESIFRRTRSQRTLSLCGERASELQRAEQRRSERILG